MRGKSLVEVVALGFVGVVVASLLVVLGCSEKKENRQVDEAQFIADKTMCLNNVRQLVYLIEMEPSGYPKQSGANMILYFVQNGEIKPEGLDVLFCPSDPDESLEKAGGAAAYKDLDLAKQGAYGRLTSYAGRNQLDAKCVARKGTPHAVVLVADDSDDHHRGRGIVVGMSGGAVRWRDKIDDYQLDQDTEVTVGEGSPVGELVCLRAD